MIEAKRPADLPEFESPPITEAVFGVQYSAEHRIGLRELGLFSEQLKAEFPDLEMKPPLGSWQDSDKITVTSIELSGTPPLPRCWLISEDKNKLIQLQEDRFVHNWRKVDGVGEYPRYETILHEFIEKWGLYKEFLLNRGIGPVKEDIFELSYINHIEKTEELPSDGSLADLLSILLPKGSDGFLPAPTSIAYKLRYELPGGNGFLVVAINPAITTKGNKEIIQLQLTARGPFAKEHERDIPTWFSLAREWIVRGFTDLTTPKAHKAWRRKQ